MTDREAIVRELSFEEEAAMYEQEARNVFAKEGNGGEAPMENQIIRRGMRVIKKARAALQERIDRDGSGADRTGEGRPTHERTASKGPEI